MACFILCVGVHVDVFMACFEPAPAVCKDADARCHGYRACRVSNMGFESDVPQPPHCSRNLSVMAMSPPSTKPFPFMPVKALVVAWAPECKHERG